MGDSLFGLIYLLEGGGPPLPGDIGGFPLICAGAISSN